MDSIITGTFFYLRLWTLFGIERRGLTLVRSKPSMPVKFLETMNNNYEEVWFRFFYFFYFIFENMREKNLIDKFKFVWY
jgi:hypothetical protein